MKKLLIILISIASVGCRSEVRQSGESQHHNHESETVKQEKSGKKVLSPHTYAMAMIGDAHVHIDYSSPGVRGRIIFGGLVGYDHVWQAGAHMATWIETDKDLIIEDQILRAGKYGFFTIPGRENWTIIFNKNWDQHGKDEYDPKEDIMRFKVESVISTEIKEHLEYEITKTNDNEGTISLSWEKVTVSFPFKIKR
jgi:hypothetical protein